MIEDSLPFFSIVTISYNQAGYLSACLDSVRHQDFQSYEHILVDPGSSDQSRELIVHNTVKTRHIFEPDNGPADGLNKGFAAARGRYVLFINADDYLLPGALTVVYSTLRVHAWPDLLFMGGRKVDERAGFSKRIFPGSTLGIVHALGLSTFFQQGTVVNLAAFHRSKGFNVMNSTCWDGELFLELLSSSLRVNRNPKEIAAFRIHGSSISGSGRLYSIYLQDQANAVRRLYPQKALSLRGALLALPKILRSILKYLADPFLFGWQLRDLLAGQSRSPRVIK